MDIIRSLSASPSGGVCRTRLALCLALALLVTILTSWQAGADSVPPPVLPEDWERDVTDELNPKMLAERPRSVKREAIPALLHLYEDERWSGFRSIIIHLVELHRDQEAIAFLRARFRALLCMKPSPEDSGKFVLPDDAAGLAGFLGRQGTPEDRTLLERALDSPDVSLHRYCISALDGCAGPGTDEVIRRHFLHFVALDGEHAFAGNELPYWPLRQELDGLCLYLWKRLSPDEHLATLEAAARIADARLTPYLIPEMARHYRHPRAIHALRMLASYTTTTRHEKAITENIEYIQGAIRAQQPMPDAKPLPQRQTIRVASERPKQLAGVTEEYIVGLGRKGSWRSVRTYLKLRNLALCRPGIPKSPQNYTYAQKIIESAAIALAFVTEGHLAHSWRGLAQDEAARCWVSADFKLARIDAPGVKILLKRFGSEWLVVEVEDVAIPFPMELLPEG